MSKENYSRIPADRVAGLFRALVASHVCLVLFGFATHTNPALAIYTRQDSVTATSCPTLLLYLSEPPLGDVLADRISSVFQRDPNHLQFLRRMGAHLEKIHPAFSRAQLEKYWVMPKGQSGKARNGAHLYVAHGHHFGGMAYVIDSETITVYHQYIDSAGLTRAMGLPGDVFSMNVHREILLLEFMFLRRLKPPLARRLKIVWHVPKFDLDQRLILETMGFKLKNSVDSNAFANTGYHVLERWNHFTGHAFLDNHDNWAERNEASVYNRALTAQSHIKPALLILPQNIAPPMTARVPETPDRFPPAPIEALAREITTDVMNSILLKAYLDDGRCVGMAAGRIVNSNFELLLLLANTEQVPAHFSHVRRQLYNAISEELLRRGVRTVAVRSQDIATQQLLRNRIGLDLAIPNPQRPLTQWTFEDSVGIAFELSPLSLAP